MTQKSKPVPGFLASFYNSETYSDVVLQVKGDPEVRFFAHRIVLSQSEYFVGLFNSKMKETTVSVEGKLRIELSEISPAYLETFLMYLYGQPLDFSFVKFTDCLELYSETQRFLVPSFQEKLRDAIEKYVYSGLSVPEIVTYLEFAHVYDFSVTKLNLTPSVVCQISYSAVLYFVTHVPDGSTIPVLLWITTHLNAPEEQHRKLIQTARPNRIRREEIDIIKTYCKTPLLTEYILHLLCQNIQRDDLKYGPSYLGKSYTEVLEIQRQVEAGILVKEEPVEGCPSSHRIILPMGNHDAKTSYHNDRWHVRTTINDFISRSYKKDVVGRLVDGVVLPLTQEEKDYLMSQGYTLEP